MATRTYDVVATRRSEGQLAAESPLAGESVDDGGGCDVEGGVPGRLEEREAGALGRAAGLEDGAQEVDPVEADALQLVRPGRWRLVGGARPLDVHGGVRNGVSVDLGTLGAADGADVRAGAEPVAFDHRSRGAGAAEDGVGVADGVADRGAPYAR